MSGGTFYFGGATYSLIPAPYRIGSGPTQTNLRPPQKTRCTWESAKPGIRVWHFWQFIELSISPLVLQFKLLYALWCSIIINMATCVYAYLQYFYGWQWLQTAPEIQCHLHYWNTSSTLGCSQSWELRFVCYSISLCLMPKLAARSSIV